MKKAQAPKKTVRPPARRAKPSRPARKPGPQEKLLRLIVEGLDAKKAEDLRVLDVSALSSITDYLVIGTANSEPHLRALRIEIERVLDEQKARILSVDSTKGSGWVVVDAFEVMVHVFTPETRDRYRVEQLWHDAVEVPLSGLVS